MRALLLISGSALLTGATMLAPSRVSLLEQGRNLVRPILLPVLWAGLESAQRDGSPEEYADRGRVLMRLIPDWTDGHIHIAGQLAFEASSAQGEDTEAAVDRLLAGLEYLSEVRSTTTDPSADESLLKSQARFLYIRAGQDEKLAAAIQRRIGESPTTRVSAYLRQIPRFRDSVALQSELCFTLIGGLKFDAFDGKSFSRLIALLDEAVALLPAVRDEELATSVRTSLQNLRNYLVRPDEILLEELHRDPFLKDIVEALQSRRAK